MWTVGNIVPGTYQLSNPSELFKVDKVYRFVITYGEPLRVSDAEILRLFYEQNVGTIIYNRFLIMGAIYDEVALTLTIYIGTQVYADQWNVGGLSNVMFTTTYSGYVGAGKTIYAEMNVGTEPPLPPEEHVTPWSATLPAGNYRVPFPEAIAVNGITWPFSNWRDLPEGDPQKTTPVRYITLVAETLSLFADYEEPPPPEHVLTITTTAGGTTNPAPGNHTYIEGTVVSVSATALINYVFDHLELDGVNIGGTPISVTMDTDHTLHAVFVEAPPVNYTLTVTATSGGTTEPALGLHTYIEGNIVMVTAKADTDPKYRFIRWELDGVVFPQNPINILMSKDHTIHAVFEYVPPSPVTATIKGTVKDAKTAKPLVGAIVTCDGYTDVTEIDGSYEFTDIPAAPYTLTAQMAGYEILEITIDTTDGGTFIIDFELATPQLFDRLWSQLVAFSEGLGLPVPPKPSVPKLPFEALPVIAAAAIAIADIALLGYYLVTNPPKNLAFFDANHIS